MPKCCKDGRWNHLGKLQIDTYANWYKEYIGHRTYLNRHEKIDWIKRRNTPIKLVKLRKIVYLRIVTDNQIGFI